jgi:hypothetical protein
MSDVQRSTSPLFRRPVRVSITVPHHIHAALLSRSDQEGRSLSNLAAFLLEASLSTFSES